MPDDLKRLKVLRATQKGATRARPPTAPLSMTHPTLGPLQGSTDGLVGDVRLGDDVVRVTISRGDEALEDSLAFASRLVQDLTRTSRLAAECIADKHLDSYNDTWRFGDEVEPDGRRVPFEDPALSREEFIARLRLGGVRVEGTASSELRFDNEDMFWGHWFVVASVGGAEFSSPWVEMRG